MALGRGALREDGAQRHRVRPDAGVAEGFHILSEKRELEIDPLQVAEIWRAGMTLALQARLCSRVEDSVADRLVAVTRQQFGGHAIRSKP